ncbi:metal ABC transporter ATP-binding protein [Trueperella bialowiezensis]|uniref:Sulfate/thiosulfate import ATP-binding protein CysA n=1 Tax=Trueperella bialowiezensis TaxID=312285 RepID=A0A448PGD8_9ACTO|nr:metal ABC transporter ATP-binding protein [Trueperella bialowiezensis]VEI13982.1 Sulfate/thiosulfate import ATP-binding protein CysA [Trueperella bialowiezensis]
MSHPVVSTRDLTVYYRDIRALNNVSVDITNEGITGVIGPNGSGKSTFLKALVGLVPSTGEITTSGVLGYMPQSASVDWDFPVTVYDVVAMGTYQDLGWFARLGGKHKARVEAALADVGMSQFASRPIGALSGGQRQRVFLARALAQQPDVLLLDEPFAGVDVASQEAIEKVLRQLTDTTIVLVHHDLADVAELCDNVVLLDDGALVHAGEFDHEQVAATFGTQVDTP